MKEIKGLRSGKLIATGRQLKLSSSKYGWYSEAKCDCGKIMFYLRTGIVSLTRRSCGCARQGSSNCNFKHGKANTRIHIIWKNMIARCYNKKNRFYPNYGERGIGVFKDWKEDFMSFYKWTISNGYFDNLTLDRINVNKGYEPNNCRFITMKEQQNNRRNNRIININNELRTLSQWADSFGITCKVLWQRINTAKKYGESDVDVIKKHIDNPEMKRYIHKSK